MRLLLICFSTKKKINNCFNFNKIYTVDNININKTIENIYNKNLINDIEDKMIEEDPVNSLKKGNFFI